MPLQILSRPTTDTVTSRSPSPFATPTSKPQIPTICLTTATPCDSNPANESIQVAPWTTGVASPVPIAPKSSANGESSRRRIVPKKSKLSLLGSATSSGKVRGKDFSDVVRRVGSDASTKNGCGAFEIYVDPANDPDLGEILMVKKKKSRLGLDGMQWGALGEVTNVPAVTKTKEKGSKKESLLKVKVDENQKWWSIGRGRKDSKEKDKGRSKSPQPSDVPTDARARYNSLDSGALFAGATDTEPTKPSRDERIPTPPSATLAPPNAAPPGGGKGSVALRAMRSVRSLARIGSWAQLRSTPNPDAPVSAVAPVKDKDPDGKKKKKKKEKEKEKEKAKETKRYSGSSFEAGALSPVESKHEMSKSLGKKKASILGLGLPSTMRLPSSRSGSTASSIVAARRSSADSATLLGGGILARSASTMSTTSSLRPVSTKSRQSSDSSGVASVKWDEAGLQTVKEIRQKDRETKSKAKEVAKEDIKEKKVKRSKSEKEKRSTRKLSDSRKRAPLSAIFPGTVSERDEDEREEPPLTPIITIEEATADGHEREDGDSMKTPVRSVRPRPLSDQPLGGGRPKPLHEGDDDNAFLSLLDAATNDLAQLINRLDLEATPASVDATPMNQRSLFSADPSANLLPSKRLTAESPVKMLCRKSPSMTSLKPYTQTSSKNNGVRLGQNIAPWSTLNASISPSKPSPNTVRVNFQDNMATVRTHRRTMTPAPAAEPSPVFKPLRPATTRLPISKTVVNTTTGISPFIISMADRSPSTLTFGSSHSKSESKGSFSASPVFKKAQGHARKRSSLVPESALDSGNLPMAPEARRSLGLAGTMGGSIAEQDYDGSDPDSDIPDELQVILSNSDQEDTLSFNLQPTDPSFTSLGSPPGMPLPPIANISRKSSLAQVPVFRATVVDEDDHHADVDEAETLSEDDTKKSFDFTGELQKLNESGGSDRRSFIEQLENAFRTPAKIDLEYDFGDVPPVPKLPTLEDELSRAGETSFSVPIDYESRVLSPRGFPIDVNADPSLLPGSDSFATTVEEEELLEIMEPEVARSAPSVATHPSNGELNRDFKFGGKHSLSSKDPELLTLSDIIPPPEIARSLSMASLSGNESSLIKSILVHAIELDSPDSPPEHSCLDSNPSIKGKACETAEEDNTQNLGPVARHKRSASALSFAGFDSFAEVRRGFEFHNNRPGFYPPVSTSDKLHRKHNSVYSIASVSSYGKVLHGGSADPFDYGTVASLPGPRGRPSSYDFSFTMSTTVDDTFSFLRRQPHRRRVDSDASSFYFRSSLVHPYNRSHRRQESGISVCPPVSLFNRNSTYRRRVDSNASMSSITQSYANCMRFSWSRPLSTYSVESVLSDFAGGHLGRPGLGDKMLESAQERGTPLVSISASPSPSPIGSLREELNRSEEYGNRTSYDSIMDVQQESQKTDSLFEKTGHRNSVCSTDSMFFEDDSAAGHLKPRRYRPISSLSIQSVHSPPKEDDTMISMLGGGRIRRRSVTSMIGSSPCIQVERRRNLLANPPETVFSRIKKVQSEDHESPEKSHVIESKPSIASTVNSFQFGDERMIRAKHGLLERQSLENTVLSADGEEFSTSFRVPVFTRPPLTSRSRSSTYTSSSGADTPPLSMSDGYSSLSEGSLSSIDLSQLNVLLSNATHPLSNAAFDRARPHSRGHGHRRRISQARASRTSIYEIIEEELTSQTNSPEQSNPGSTSNTVKLTEAATNAVEPPPAVYIMDPETSSVESISLWDDEGGIMALRRYYALRDEAEDAVTESKQTWSDTPFSVYAMQSFDPPRHPSGMQALLEHSLQNFGPLPSELRSRRARSRANSRPSPYPRTVKTSFTSSPATEHLRATVAASLTASIDNAVSRHSVSNALQQKSIDPNLPSMMTLEPKECMISPEKPERVFGLPPRPRAGSAVRRGLPKKSASRNGAENKENNVTIGKSSGGQTAINVSQGTIMTPADGLRLNRPRPKGRPTPASARLIRA